MKLHQQVWNYFQQHQVASLVAKISVIVVFSSVLLVTTLGINVQGAHAQSALSAQSTSYASGNPFPYPSCTWWADQRYHQLHGVFVPWRTNANAWQWTARARQFGWHVSTRPTIGSIIDLQPWVQGAYGAGHVAVVERILRNGHVITSNMSWGRNPYRVTYVEFAPGRGVTFITR